ncbi:S-layer homology domain-containing protein [Thermobacillus sp.]|uniref:S-layer homology domain-containing protein n=1 Tax=Thermobacillus sp. TaxID=2108467 RepID=UPI00257E4F95|nr:S-layer homology domain-containing protein [Thermobacillus sp.]
MAGVLRPAGVSRFRRWVAAWLSAIMVLSCAPLPAQATPAPADGTLDYPSLATATGIFGQNSTTFSPVDLSKLNDDDTATHPGDFYTPNSYFTLDFGVGNGVKVSQVSMQARANFAARMSNGRVLGSLDGTVWKEITVSRASGSVTDMQTLDILLEDQAVPYRFLRIMGDGSNNIFNIGELRISGELVEPENLLGDVAIFSDHPDDPSKALAGDTVTVSFTSTEPIANVKLYVNGKTYAAQSEDQIHWTASFTVSPYDFPKPVAFAVAYTDTTGNYGRTAFASTDGSSVTVEEPDDHLDLLTLAAAFGIPTANGSINFGSSQAGDFASRIMDRDASTYANWNGPNNDGYASLVIDMGEGNAVSLDRVYLLARPDQVTRIAGAYLQGSHDGETWIQVSGKAAASADWQTLTITDPLSYRYLKITNDNRWYLNMSEIKFYGKFRQAGDLYPDDLQIQVNAAQAIVDKGQQSYSDDTWQALLQALAEAQAALDELDGGSITQEELDALTAALTAAINGLKVEVRVLETISPEGFIHPGVAGLTKEVLENLRTQILNQQEPWYSYYQAMLETSFASKNFSMSNSLDGVNIRQDAYNARNVRDMALNDGQRAFTQALLYFITGDETYRANALRILRIWGQMDPDKYQYYTDAHIHNGIPLYYMIAAAEILRYTTSSEELRWTEEDTETFVRHVVNPTVRTFLDFNDKFMNQHNYPLYGSIAAYIFTDDKENYAKAVEWLTVNASAPDPYMTGSIYWLFREMTQNDDTGDPVEPHVQHVEMGRDLAHGEGDVVNFINLARLVDAQGTKVDPVTGTIAEDGNGVSIYEFLNDRILKGADYYAKNALGYDIVWTPVKATAASETAKEKIYMIPSDEYRGRFHYLGLGGWDLYYVYRYKLGYTEEELEQKAPYFVKAFRTRVEPNHYFSGDGSSADVARMETGAEWWVYIPAEVAQEPADSIARRVKPSVPQEQRYILQLDEAYSIIDGSNEVKESADLIWTESEGDVRYIRAIASDNQTLFAAYRIFFINRNNTSNVALKFRTNGRALLELKKDKDSAPFRTLELPDTGGEWRFITFDMGKNSVSYGQFPNRTFLMYVNVVGDGSTVDIDYMDIKADNTLTPPVFNKIEGPGLTLSLFAGSTVNYDFSATDPNNSDTVSYELQGDALPGAALNPATGAFSWSPTEAEAGTYQSLIVASDGVSVSTLKLTVHVAADRMAAIANVIAPYRPDKAYESDSLESFEHFYDQVLGMLDSASDSDFYAALDELTKAVADLKLLNPLLPDGSLDFTRSSVSTSLQPGFDSYLVDNNPVTFSGDLTAKYFTMDFGPNFRVAPTAFALQPRNIWPERMSGAIIFGSNDGDNWVRLTDEAAYENKMQQLSVREERLGEAYRFFKVSTLESTDYYARKNTILSVGEFRIYGERIEIPTRISHVSIHTDATPLTQHMQGSDAANSMQVPVKKAVAGNKLWLEIKTKQPLTQLNVKLAGMDALVTRVDDLNYVAEVVLDEEAARRNASRKASIEITYRYLDAKNNNVETEGAVLTDTTDGSSVLISDVSRRIDDIMSKATVSFNRPTDNGAEIGPRLFDRNTTTFVDVRNEKSAGGGVYYLFDFGEGAVSLTSVEVAPRMTTNHASRMIGVYVQGSNDGKNFVTITDSRTKLLWDWQGLIVTDNRYFRYIRIINDSVWFGNLSEVEFFGTYVEDGSTVIEPPTEEPGEEPGEDPGSGPGNGGGNANEEDGSTVIEPPTEEPGEESGENPGSGSGNGGGNANNPPVVNNPPAASEPSKPVAIIAAEGLEETALEMRVEANEAIVRLDDLSETVFSNPGITVLTVPAVPDADAYAVTLPMDSLSGAHGTGILKLETELGSIMIPGNMLSELPGSTDREAAIIIRRADPSDLPDDVKTAVGDRPVIQLEVLLDGVKLEWNNPDAPVIVTVPYTPTDEEMRNPDKLTVWYVDGSGTPVAVPSGRYDHAAGAVRFSTTHFSHFAVVYVERTFDDLAGAEWARHAVEVLASKGIVNGVGGGMFAPGRPVTRAEFVTMLVRTLGLAGKPGQPGAGFADVPQEAYYAEAVGIAKQLGIVRGSGDNRFDPESPITRQDMMVMAARALNLSAAGDTAVLERFRDKARIADYAASSLSALIQEGLIVGSGGYLNPRAQTTRAETAMFLYRIYMKIYS